MSNMTVKWWWLLVALAAGFALCYWWPMPAPTPITKIVTVPQYLKARPDTVLTFRERLVYVKTPPETISVTPPFDTASVSEFCRRAAAAKDTTKNSTPKPAPILPRFSGTYREGRLQLFATRSDGSGWSGVYAAHAPMEWSAGQETVTVLSRRRLPGAVRVLGRTALCAGAGYGARELTGDARVAVGVSVGCIAGVAMP